LSDGKRVKKEEKYFYYKEIEVKRMWEM